MLAAVRRASQMQRLQKAAAAAGIPFNREIVAAGLQAGLSEDDVHAERGTSNILLSLSIFVFQIVIKLFPAC